MVMRANANYQLRHNNPQEASVMLEELQKWVLNLVGAKLMLHVHVKKSNSFMYNVGTKLWATHVL